MEKNKTVLDQLFGKEDNITLTENGDIAFKELNNPLLDILFKSEYFRNRLSEVSIGTSDKERLFAMFMRDPRYGFGQKNLGRELLKQSGASFEDVLKCGRADDLWMMYHGDSDKFNDVCDYVKSEIEQSSELSELIKKWCPRFPTHNIVKDENGNKVKSPFNDRQRERAVLARRIATRWGFNKQEYGKFIKASTVEKDLSLHEEDNINFEHVPSLASVKYAPTFARNPKTAERYKEYIEGVKNGTRKVNVSVTTVYDIYKNMNNSGFEADLWYSKLPKISGSFLPIIDVSGSMYNSEDSIGKALSIGYYISDCSSYCNRQFVTFSCYPQLVSLSDTGLVDNFCKMKKADWGCNTNLGAVMNLLSDLSEYPEYLVILSDMQFDRGSSRSKNALRRLWKDKGYTTKIVWWNFNSRSASCPETDDMGNIFMSGYSPILLQYLESGFDGNQFLEKLLQVYAQKIGSLTSI